MAAKYLKCLEAASGFEPENNGFADRCLTSWLCRLWSGKRDSNPRLRPWQGRTLPLSYSRSPLLCLKNRRTCQGEKLFSLGNDERKALVLTEMFQSILFRASPSFAKPGQRIIFIIFIFSICPPFPLPNPCRHPIKPKIGCTRCTHFLTFAILTGRDTMAA